MNNVEPSVLPGEFNRLNLVQTLQRVDKFQPHN